MAAEQPLDSRALALLGPTIRKELEQLLTADAEPAAVLHSVFRSVCGEGRNEEERRLFLSFAAPIARRIVCARAPQDERVCGTRATVREARIYLDWLGRYDRLAVEAIDLHYVAGMRIREVAQALSTQPENVVRGLRNTWGALNLELQ